jgi:ATP-dependent DNA helicase RecG
MTATPIPRTLTMSLYGDLDVSTIDEMPAGRGRIVTAASRGNELPDVLAFLRRELEAGRQAYIIYPLIDESEKLDAKAATAEFEKWRERLPPFICELLHGRVPAPEKQATMDRFRRGLTNVLISTTVIEVGVDVPNATVMLSGERGALRPRPTASVARANRARRTQILLHSALFRSFSRNHRQADRPRENQQWV